jgi:hypothetical protein
MTAQKIIERRDQNRLKRGESEVYPRLQRPANNDANLGVNRGGWVSSWGHANTVPNLGSQAPSPRTPTSPTSPASCVEPPAVTPKANNTAPSAPTMHPYVLETEMMA